MSRLYGIVDCAQDPRLHGWVKATPEHTCLLQGKIDPKLEMAAPHLVAMDKTTMLCKQWRSEGWRDGGAWGVLCRSSLDMISLRIHLKKFLQAKLPTGQVVMFRFYDPRVWEVYWQTLGEGERRKWLIGGEIFIFNKLLEH